MPFTDNLPSKSQIFDYWKDRLGQLGFVIDWGEPSCWACRFHYGTKYDIKRSDVGWDTILHCWSKIPLQRCHIIPRSLGGTDDVSNLFLMCRECHDLAPNTSIPAIFFEWARRQSSEARENSKVRVALESFGIGEAAAEDVLRVFLSKGFRSWKRGKFALHWPQSKYAPLSCRLTTATTVGLAVYYWRIQKPSPERPAKKMRPKRRGAALSSALVP